MDAGEPVRRCGWPSCGAACCLHGAWVSETKIAEIRSFAAEIIPLLPTDRQAPGAWFQDPVEPDPYVPGGSVRQTRVVDEPGHYGGTACVFLLGDYRCALQAAGEAAGRHPWHLKPLYCILHPLDVDEKGRITLDEIRHMVEEEASCLRRARDPVVLRTLFREEIDYFKK